MINIDALAGPITSLLSAFGTGTLPANGPADSLVTSSKAIDAAYGQFRAGVVSLEQSWGGKAADNALFKSIQTQQAAEHVAERGTEMAVVVRSASQDVAAGVAELEKIAESFVKIVLQAGPQLLTPPGQIMVLDAAVEHLHQALTVVSKVRSQMATHAAKMTEIAPAEAPTEAKPEAATPDVSKVQVQAPEALPVAPVIPQVAQDDSTAVVPEVSIPAEPELPPHVMQGPGAPVLEESDPLPPMTQQPYDGPLQPGVNTPKLEPTQPGMTPQAPKP